MALREFPSPRLLLFVQRPDPVSVRLYRADDRQVESSFALVFPAFSRFSPPMSIG